MKKRQLWLGISLGFLLVILSQLFLTTTFQGNDDHLKAKALTPDIEQMVKQYQIQQPDRGDVRLLIISDLNSAYGSTEYDPEVHLAIKMIPFWQPDLVVSSGDMIAGQKRSLTPTQIRAMWQSFEQNIAQPIRDLNIPFGFTIGNHDASGATTVDKTKFLFQQERDLAVEYWQNPNHDPQVNFIDRSEFPFYYTFTQDDLFFLVWDGSTSRIPSEKIAWVEQSLASATAQQAKMRFIIGHLPLYAVAEGRNSPGEVLNDADKLRKLLEKYDVHTYISGHHHAYYPAHKGDLQLLHTGSLGGGSRLLIAENSVARKTMTIVDVNFDSPDLTTYTTYDLQDFAIIDQQQLPRLLRGHNGLILRRDIEMEDLTPQEKELCQQQYGMGNCVE